MALRSPFGRRPIVLITALFAGFLWVACTDEPVVAPESQEARLDLRDLAPGVQLQELAPSMVVLERNRNRLLARPGVVGTAMGLTDRGRPQVQLYVDGPVLDDAPVEVDGIPVLVIETGPIVALQEATQEVPQGPPARPNAPPCGTPPCGGGGDGGGGGSSPTERFDPIPIGVSTGHVDITAGTIGARVLRGGQAFALSNNHVLANSNNASTGDDILQPGAFDGGKAPADVFADLSDFVTIKFGGQANFVDAAIAAPNGSRTLLASTPSGGYGTPRSSPLPASVNMRVMKYGRTTGLTKGRVQAIGATVNVNYGGPGVARFEEQIIIGGGGFSAGGDSGSLIVVERGGDARRPVGLLFAGGSGITIANRIQDVLAALNIAIDGN